MKQILLVLVTISLASCGDYNNFVGILAPIGLCPVGAAVRGTWICDQATLEAKISSDSDSNYVTYPQGIYQGSAVGVSCNFTISTVQTTSGPTCFIQIN